MKEFGCILEACPPCTVQINENNAEEGLVSYTQRLWQETYPNEPFFLAAEQASSESIEKKSSNLLSGVDLLASTERQATFLWQVPGEQFDDIEFLNEGVENYYRFLCLKPKAQSKKQILVPTYQIDLMWHTHILSSIALYNKDCKAIVGSMFHYDNSLNDRT